MQSLPLWAPTRACVRALVRATEPWETVEPARELFLLATQMYFFYLVVNRASVCTSNNSKTDINCPRRWALILSQDVPLASCGHARARGHAREAHNALLPSCPARAGGHRSGKVEEARRSVGFAFWSAVPAGPPTAWVLGVGVITMGPKGPRSSREASGGWAAWARATCSWFRPFVRTGRLNVPGEAGRAAGFARRGLVRLEEDSTILLHLLRLSTPRGQVTYPGGWFPLGTQK